MTPLVAKLYTLIRVNKGRLVDGSGGALVHIHRRAQVHFSVSFLPGKGGRIIIGENCVLARGVVLRAFGGSIELGKGSTVGPYAVLDGQGGLRIGANVMIASHSALIPGNHGFRDIEVPMIEQDVICEGIEIHDDVWLGAGAKVLDGVVVGKGAVIAAGAVVTKSVAPYSIMAGVPARAIRVR